MPWISSELVGVAISIAFVAALRQTGLSWTAKLSAAYPCPDACLGGAQGHHGFAQDVQLRSHSTLEYGVYERSSCYPTSYTPQHTTGEASHVLGFAMTRK